MYRGGILEEFKNAFKKQDNGLLQIILINIAVFIVLNLLGVFLWLFGFSDYRPNQCTVGSTDLFCRILMFIELPADPLAFIKQPWTLVTYFFTHLSFFHILFNMLFLYWFGKLIQEFFVCFDVVIH